ncbi:hypothetical protein [Methyloversatilis thermotolerans]|uniref:hypothetical protein n=1 Tax=Methyloversatilis thermotolerans TaxID=1346290 RepID=UPI0018DED97A|nr:hypothetical protein [Methyloversatilis thermotolerans]
MFERLMAAFITASCSALLLCCALAVAAGQRIEWLQGNHGIGPWLYLTLWLLIATASALRRTPLQVWRTGLLIAAMTAASVAASGLLSHAPLAAPVALCGGVLALLLAACWRSLASAGTPPSSAAAPRGLPRPPRQRRALDILRAALPWLALSACFIDSFRIGMTSGDQRGTGHAGMLITFFLMLPAVSLSFWFRGATAIAWLAGCALLGALALHADRPVLALLALLAAAGTWHLPRPQASAGRGVRA